MLMHIVKVTSLAQGQPYGCPSASEVTLKNMGQSDQYMCTQPLQDTTKHKSSA